MGYLKVQKYSTLLSLGIKNSLCGGDILGPRSITLAEIACKRVELDFEGEVLWCIHLK